MRVQVSGSIYHIGGKDLHVYIGNQIKASHFVLSLRQYTLQMLNMMTEKPHSDTVCNYTLNRGAAIPFDQSVFHRSLRDPSR